MMLDPDGGEAVGIQDPAGGLGPGNSPAGILGGVAAEGAVYVGAGPHGQKHRRQHQDDISPIKNKMEFLLTTYKSSRGSRAS